jgi:hypothetical protein
MDCGVTDFDSFRYWYRVWMLQETGLGHSAAVAHLGEFRFLFRQAVSALERVLRCQCTRSALFKLGAALEGLHALRSFNGARCCARYLGTSMLPFVDWRLTTDLRVLCMVCSLYHLPSSRWMLITRLLSKKYSSVLRPLLYTTTGRWKYWSMGDVQFGSPTDRACPAGR